MNKEEEHRQQELAQEAAESPSLTQQSSGIQQALDLAIQHHSAGRLTEAESIYLQIMKADPNQPVAVHLLGVIAFQVGKNDMAVDLINMAITLDPGYADAHSNLGNALQELGKLDDAVASYNKALAIKPDFADAYSNLGKALKKLKRLDEAMASYHKALEIRPDYAEAHNNLGNVLKDLGKLDEAVASYDRALAIKPNYVEAHSNLIFLQDFFPDIDQVSQQKERERWNSNFILPLHKNIEPHNNDKNPERLLRIGYVSADFRSHSAHAGFGPLIIDHDRNNFEVICYDATIVSDDVSATLRAAATHWRYIKNMSDAELANTMRNDAIDILVDLSGHTHGNRLKVFGYKPAPLQLSGIGHLAPGISTIDYRLTTAQITPPVEENIYPEKPIYLDTYFGFTPPPDTLPVIPPPCLQNGFITFGFFGRFSKTSDETFALWAKILQGIPDSQLLLKYKELDDPDTRKKINEMFSGLGIDEERLILLGKTDQQGHLEAHNRVDIVLDTAPHGGGITTLESLWMGVPVIGLMDATKAVCRLIDCIVRPVGLQDWVAHNGEEYCAIATQWAGRTEELAQIRQQLRQRVCDVYFKFPQDVEKSYRLIWQRWCAGEKPAPLYPVSSQALS